MSDDELVKYAVCGLCGIAFGIAAEKGRVHEPALIRGQMDFSSDVMMKMFLSAAASGLVSMSMLYLTSNANKSKLDSARSTFLSCISNKGWLSCVLGGGMLGAGMTIAGTCPGMVMVQIGSQTAMALYTLAGGLSGALLYSLLERQVTELTGGDGPSMRTLDDNNRGYVSTALPVAAAFAAGIFYLEGKVPDFGLSNISMSSKSWSPVLSGTLIGLLQIPLILTIRDTLGTSSSYFTVLSQALITDRLRRALPYLEQYKRGFANWWQVYFVGGMVAGGYLSAQSSGSLGASSPVTQGQALVGGALMVFGSRMASGCTSGHGLSGMALLVVNSYITTCAMFAGAMGTYAAMKKGMI